MSDPAVRQVGESHAAVLASLHEATIGGGWGATSVARLLALPGAAGLLALAPAGETPDGFLLLLPAGDDMEIAAIGVLPAARRRGHGRRLVEAALDFARYSGAARCLLEVAADNKEAVTLYITCGFTQYGTRPGYYRRPGGKAEDALLFARRLEGRIPLF